MSRREKMQSLRRQTSHLSSPTKANRNFNKRHNERVSSKDKFDDESKIAIEMSIGIEKVILPTISVIGNNDTILTALLDTGAQISIITPQASRRLGKNIKVSNLVRSIKIRGVVDNRSIIIEKYVKLRLLSINRTAEIRLNCYVIEMNQKINATTIESIKSKGINIS
jgi:Aspartyl protease